MNVREKVLETVKRENMISPDSTVIVGLSGGADSVTLLHVLISLRDELSISQIVAVHVNHQLRGEESLHDQQFAEHLCKEWMVPFYLHTYDVRFISKQLGKGIEEMGRELRYGAFHEVASRFSRSYVATAHTATDNAETLLFHLCRGCGLHGLTGIPPVRDTIIRPLIDCSRGEIEDYCRINHLCYTTDSTNEDTTYTRNRIRHDVLPILKRVHPAADRSIQRLIAHMREVDAFLEREADTYWENIKTNERGIYRKSSLSSLDPVIQTRLLQRMLHEWDITPDDLHLQQMQECLKTDGVVTLQSGVCFAVSKDRICISPKTPKICVTDETMTIIPGTVVCFGGENYRITVISRKEYEQKLNISKFVFKNVCDYDTICGDLVLRKRQAGDTYHPAGRHCGKTFKKLFNESSVLPEKRDRMPILCDNDGVILVFGFGCDERVRITDGTEKILMIEKIKE